MKICCIKLIIFFIGLTLSRALPQVHATSQFNIPVGGGKNQISIFKDQTGLDFEISENEELYLLDFINNSIKVFSKEGQLRNIIKVSDKKIQKFFIYKKSLIVLAAPSSICFFSLAGDSIGEHEINSSSTLFFHSQLYEGNLFIPVRGNGLNENLLLYQINQVSKKSFPEKVEIRIFKTDSITGSYDPDRSHQFLPIEKEDYQYLKNLNPAYTDAFSEKYYIFTLNEGEGDGGILILSYYVFMKKTKTFKRIGLLPEEITGENYSMGWGMGHRIYGDGFYILGVKYSKERPRKALQVIISEIDLSAVGNLPDIQPNWKF